jgi:hypothetical protein
MLVVATRKDPTTMPIIPFFPFPLSRTPQVAYQPTPILGGVPSGDEVVMVVMIAVW